MAWLAFQCITQFLDFQHILHMLRRVFLLYKEQVVFQVCQSVGLELAEKYNVLIIIEGEIKCQLAQMS